ncbi:signal recognition particle 14 kDa protein isoform X3 [Hypanus sabinus]|uniref:signal recognition particle 14 kDa protein isoform X3 n=1 Tax=Hypanus sabinus TaxID=79690 RepID=UPI0028C4CB7F|nr:signal recognition particle 14 kDa protein isoform X3 [Hypanus sabinus]XP_059810185.1 signal recognition particle 14 kDa protein isoform X3 [Hypanus sabinus]XP_059810195.1 signal recognition particle 14 kDa protein isoform X3 [Hypanus sabinus]XP_059810204.1 signal recognition particle 14 kDa protein isoform X3 [Hypanus sabinus]XP_059810207.1 signal recognition particle 14 kDa protein isoform X3 [Hypanus sabinus]
MTKYHCLACFNIMVVDKLFIELYIHSGSVFQLNKFLTELTRLFQKCRTSGSIYLTMKKYDGRTKPVPRKGNPDNFEPADNKCLLRATDGKKKISTVISSKEVNKFQMAYSNLLRAHMDGLKKKDKKSKSKKTKATQ